MKYSVDLNALIDTFVENKQHSNDNETVADLLIQFLLMLDVNHIFGIPGGAIEPIYNAIARASRRQNLNAVVARHESGAAFMAQCFGKQTQTLGVCIVTTGPGATNAITAVASAYMEQIPMLIISGYTPFNKIGQGALQDSSHTGVDILKLFAPITLYNTAIADKQQFVKEFSNAILSAYGDRRGPVHLSIPRNLLESASARGHDLPDMQLLLQQQDDNSIDIYTVHRLAGMLRNKKLAIVIGERAHQAIPELMTFCQCAQALFATTPGAKGLVNPHHPMNRGVFGFAGHHSSEELLNPFDTELLLLVGTSLSEWDLPNGDINIIGADRIVHIDTDKLHFHNTAYARFHCRTNIREFFQYTLINNYGTQATKTFPHSEILPYKENNYLTHGIKIHPARLMQELSNKLHGNIQFFADAGNSCAWAIHYLHAPAWAGTRKHFRQSHCWFHMSDKFASMGWAISSAIGAAFAKPDHTIFCLTGDGSWLMSGQELTVAIQHQLNIVFVVLNDSAYGMVKHGQRLARAEAIAFELPEIDFQQLGEAMGASSHTLATSHELTSFDWDTVTQAGPVLLNVLIDEEACPPIGSRLAVLNEE